MVKKFTANCEAGGRSIPVTLYIGNPTTGNHPLNFQNRWLSETKGVSVPLNIMKSFAKLADISEKHRVSFEELCGYVIEELKASKSIVEDADEATSLAGEKGKKAKAPVQKTPAKAAPVAKVPAPVAPAARPPVAKAQVQAAPAARPPVAQAQVQAAPAARPPVAQKPIPASQTPPPPPARPTAVPPVQPPIRENPATQTTEGK
jgi:hypothetical protein